MNLDSLTQTSGEWLRATGRKVESRMMTRRHFGIHRLVDNGRRQVLCAAQRVGKLEDAVCIQRLESEGVGILRNGDQPKTGAGAIEIIAFAPHTGRGGRARAEAIRLGETHLGKTRV